MTATGNATLTPPTAEGEGEYHAHPPYTKIFIWLAALTIVELVVPFVLASQMGIAVGILIAIAIWKILLIIRYFMHLKYDARLLGFIASTPAMLASILAIGLLLDYAGWL
jgi:caa(3)-type oxidase subunit IV